MSETCPCCGRNWAYVGALGCQSAAATCRDRWHCRLPSHRTLAHPMEPIEAASSGFDMAGASDPLSGVSTPKA